VDKRETFLEKAEVNMQDGPSLVHWALFGGLEAAVLFVLVIGTLAAVLALARQK